MDKISELALDLAEDVLLTDEIDADILQKATNLCDMINKNEPALTAFHYRVDGLQCVEHLDEKTIVGIGIYMRNGKKIKAIMHLRVNFPMDLRNAKELVEQNQYVFENYKKPKPKKMDNPFERGIVHEKLEDGTIPTASVPEMTSESEEISIPRSQVRGE